MSEYKIICEFNKSCSGQKWKVHGWIGASGKSHSSIYVFKGAYWGEPTIKIPVSILKLQEKAKKIAEKFLTK